MAKLFDKAGKKGMAYNPHQDQRPLGPYRNYIWHVLRAAYATNIDPRRVEKLKLFMGKRDECQLERNNCK
ncbi:MAG: hypothetical protein ACRC4N_05385 [Gammaproteobacteria bacterium]